MPSGRLLTDGNDNDLRVVGVVDDVHEENVEGDAGWQIYYPATQATPSGAELVIRTTLPPAALATTVLRTLRDLNPKQTARRVPPHPEPCGSRQLAAPLLHAAGRVVCRPRPAARRARHLWRHLLLGHAAQTQEIGIRMALGASASRVERQVLAGTLRLALIGVVLGAVTSLATARLLASLLFATSPWDAATYVLMAAALLVVAGVSGYIPARRAARISPLVALRAN